MSKFSLLFRDGKSARRTLHRVFAVLLSLSLLMPGALQAQMIVTDGTMGPAMSLPGPEVVIPQDLGTTRGQNLFHSFQKFGIPMGESATFTGADSIANVISRVTGGEASHIDGLLRSQVGTADFFFINPSGMVFGPAAQVNVPAAFYVSTADELRFQDGSVFSAVSPGSSTLTQAHPAAFGFLGQQAADIEIYSWLNEFEPGSTVSISAGNIDIIRDGNYETIVQIEGGNIHLTAVGDVPMEVSLDGTPSSNAAGSLFMDYGRVDVSGGGGGRVSVHAGSATLQERSSIRSDNTGDRHAEGNVVININGDLEVKQNSEIRSNVKKGGHAGNIEITAAGDLKIEGNAQQDLSDVSRISSWAEPGSGGNTGTVKVKVSGLLEILEAAQVGSMTYGTGNAGDVSIEAGELIMDGRGLYSDAIGIRSDAVIFSRGNAGNIEIDVNGLMEVLNGGQVVSSAMFFTQGKAGNVVVTAHDLTINAGSSALHGQPGMRGITSEANSVGDAGSIRIEVPGTLKILDGGHISSSATSFSQGGNAGDVTVTAGELIMDGKGRPALTEIASKAEGSTGKGGTVRIEVDRAMQLFDGASISSGTNSAGNAGDVIVSANRLTLDGQGNSALHTRIGSEVGVFSQGADAGTVQIIVHDHLQLLRGGQISSSTWSDGNAGSVNIQAGKLTINRHDSDKVTGIFSDTFTEGKAGVVDVSVSGLLEILSGGRISSKASARGDAGSVKIKAGELIVDGQDSQYQTLITSLAEGLDAEAGAGAIEIEVSRSMQLLNGGGVSSSTFGKGNAGGIEVRAEELIINGGEKRSFITSDARESQGNAGRIDISVDRSIRLLNGVQISTSTFSHGNAGNVVVKAGELNMDGQGGPFETVIGSTAQPGSTGDAGTVHVSATGAMRILNGATVEASTHSTGKAGNVKVHAQELIVDRQGNPYLTGIFSRANAGSQGNAGTVEVDATDSIHLFNNAQLSTATLAGGDAGDVTVNASTLILDAAGITSDATSTSTGQVGNVTVNAGSIHLRNNSTISIEAHQTLPPERLNEPKRTLTVNAWNANTLSLDGGSKISTESTGNSPAGDIVVRSPRIDIRGDSSVSTLAQNADGGAVTLQARTIFLDDGLITTSVEGLTGDGGDILISGMQDGEPADFLIMRHGFIQANTAAPGAAGGDIGLRVRRIIDDRSGGALVVDALDRMDYHADAPRSVIQAAAPGGTKGEINVSDASLLDISGSIIPMRSQPAQPIALSTDPCDIDPARQKAGSLVLEGSTAIPEGTKSPLVIPMDGTRLDGLMEPTL